MNLNYAIFRSEPIYTINDLAQIGSHNKREKHAYNSNPDIKVELSKNNIELKPLSEKYVKGFKMLVKDYEKEHLMRMKTEREDRKRTFNQMLDKSKNVVADELLFTATNEFFKDMTKEDILNWANTCMEFVYNDLGYTKEQILHSVIHLDEATPHIHCVVIPLVKKLDKRTNTERYTISKKQYIRDKIHLSELQDKYHKRLTDKGYDLERGIKGSDRKHIKIKDYFTHVSNNSKSDLACEIIIELGDKKYWDTKYIDFKKKMTNVFKQQVIDLETILPTFKIASAIIHYDETSPHLHIVGVPIKIGGKNGMKKQVGKSDVFTKESLRKLQDKMRMLCIESFNKEYNLTNSLKGKKKGRNRDYHITEMDDYMEMKEHLEKNQERLEIANKKALELDNHTKEVKEIITDLKTTLTSKEKYVLKQEDKDKLVSYIDSVSKTNDEYKKA